MKYGLLGLLIVAAMGLYLFVVSPAPVVHHADMTYNQFVDLLTSKDARDSIQKITITEGDPVARVKFRDDPDVKSIVVPDHERKSIVELARNHSVQVQELVSVKNMFDSLPGGPLALFVVPFLYLVVILVKRKQAPEAIPVKETKPCVSCGEQIDAATRFCTSCKALQPPPKS
jgi:hypothetical protein